MHLNDKAVDALLMIYREQDTRIPEEAAKVLRRMAEYRVAHAAMKARVNAEIAAHPDVQKGREMAREILAARGIETDESGVGQVVRGLALGLTDEETLKMYPISKLATDAKIKILDAGHKEMERFSDIIASH